MVPIKVVHIITGLSLGGAEMMLYKLLGAAQRGRFDPLVVSLRDKGTLGDPIRELGVPVVALGMGGLSAPQALWRLRRVMRAFQPHMVQGWMYHGNLAATLGAKMVPRTTPVLWSIRQCLYDIRDEKWMTAQVIRLGARLSSGPAALVYNSRVSAATHREAGYHPRQEIIIPNGFDTTLFKPSPAARQAIRRELGLSESTGLIGLIARYHPVKDHAAFLEAARLFVREHEGKITESNRGSPDLNGHSPVHFLMAGSGVNQDNQELQRLIESKGLSDKISLLGQRRDIPDLTAALDIAVSSSVSEAFSNTVGEAMACGVPVTATHVGDSPDVIGDTGKTVPPRQPEMMAAAWDSLWRLGAEGRAALGAKARLRVENQYSLTAAALEYQRLYEAVYASRG
ncbi:MAG: glycosyltransferase [Deltaproteobacteria bacterium]|nr:glycosyltransferase [Deltaproteobacteria bacterium]